MVLVAAETPTEMSFIDSLFGNATEVTASQIQAEFSAVLVQDEKVVGAFKLFRDLMVFTNYRLIAVNKPGVTGSKQEITSIPWKSIKKFSCENAGFLDGDGELKIWMAGDAHPTAWQFSKKVNIKAVYAALSHYVLVR